MGRPRRRTSCWTGADVDAVFAAGDVLAVGALRALHRRGRRMPDDVAVVGVDDIPEARLAEPDRPRAVTTPHRLVVRESA